MAQNGQEKTVAGSPEGEQSPDVAWIEPPAFFMFDAAQTYRSRSG